MNKTSKLQLKKLAFFVIASSCLLFVAIHRMNQENVLNSFPIIFSQHDEVSAMKDNLIELNNFKRIPFSFELNQGQAQDNIRFLAWGHDYNLSLLNNAEAVIKLDIARRKNVQEVYLSNNTPSLEPQGNNFSSHNVSAEVHLNLIGANAQIDGVGTDKLSGVVNYYIGSDDRQWHASIPTYSKVKYQQVYDGVDMVYYGHQGGLEYDFILAPGANPSIIRMAFSGDLKKIPSLDAEGDLVLHTEAGNIKLHKPHAYQDIDGKRYEVESRYFLYHDDPSGRVDIGFAMAEYNKSQALIIDPTLTYSTYFDDLSRAYGLKIATDVNNNVYVAGVIGGSSTAAFVLKLNPAGNQVAYLTRIVGGTLLSQANGIAVDGDGNAYITGRTSSLDLPVTRDALQKSLISQNMGFVTKLDSSGRIAYSSYLGGTTGDEGHGIAVDNKHNFYISGFAKSPNFPVTNNSHLNGNQDAFITKFDSTNHLVYSVLLGGTGDENAMSIAADETGNAYVTGMTNSMDFPANTLYTANSGFNDGYVAKLDPSGTSLVYSTYLGGSDNDQGVSVKVDGSGNAYVCGVTQSRNFTLSGQTIIGTIGNADIFCAKLNPAGTSLIFLTRMGGSSLDLIFDIAIDTQGSIHLTGTTRSGDFPSNGSFGSPIDNQNGFVARLNISGTAFSYAYVFGGSQADFSYGIALDSASHVYLTGQTSSPNFPILNALDPYIGYIADDAFIMKLTEDALVEPVLPPNPGVIGNIGNLVAAVLPASRAVTVNGTATAFATIINAGTATASGCSVSLPAVVSATFAYQTTNPSTNVATGSQNTPVSLAPGASQSFVFAVKPTAAFTQTDIPLIFSCASGEAVASITGVNTFLLTASTQPTPDIVALAATMSNDGIVRSAGAVGGAFSVATVNVGVAGDVVASVDTGSASVSASFTICQTDAGANCLQTAATSVATSFAANQTGTFSVFVNANGADIPLDPAKTRVFVRFRSPGGASFGATSVAIMATR